MKKKDLKKSCYGPKGDRKVEVLRDVWGKKEEEFWGKMGRLYSAGGPTSDCDYGASNWERRSGFQRRDLRANEEIGSTV
jgi:hypothetical protein